MQANQKGFSIVELLIAAGLTAVVALGSAYVVSRTQQSATFSTVQNDIDRAQYLNLQIARNLTNIQTIYGLTSGTNDLMHCLQMEPDKVTAGSACNDGTVNKVSVYPDPANPSVYPTGFPPLAQGDPNNPFGKNIKSSLTVTPNCTAAGCQSFTVQVDTSYTSAGTGQSYKTRTSKSILPNYLFVPKALIDYSKCADPTKQILVGFDYATNKPVCVDITPAATPLGSDIPTGGGLPIRIFDSGSINIYQGNPLGDCPLGFASGGLFSGETVCNISGQIVNPPSTTIPTPATNPASPCSWKQTASVRVDHDASNNTTCTAGNSSPITMGTKCTCSTGGIYCQDLGATEKQDLMGYFYCDR